MELQTRTRYTCLHHFFFSAAFGAIGAAGGFAAMGPFAACSFCAQFDMNSNASVSKRKTDRQQYCSPSDFQSIDTCESVHGVHLSKHSYELIIQKMLLSNCVLHCTKCQELVYSIAVSNSFAMEILLGMTFVPADVKSEQTVFIFIMSGAV